MWTWRNLKFVMAVFTAMSVLSFADVWAADLNCQWPCYREHSAQPIHRTLTRRIEIERGAYEIAREPSLYGWAEKEVAVAQSRVSWKDHWEPTYHVVKKRILLRPYKNIAIYHRAQHRFVRERVVIYPESPESEPAYRGSAKDW